MPLRISAALYDQLAAWAEEDFRSVNGQIEYLLTECVKQRNAGPCGKRFMQERCAPMQQEALHPEYNDGLRLNGAPLPTGNVVC